MTQHAVDTASSHPTRAQFTAGQTADRRPSSRRLASEATDREQARAGLRPARRKPHMGSTVPAMVSFRHARTEIPTSHSIASSTRARRLSEMVSRAHLLF
jgi:hypothetical protein